MGIIIIIITGIISILSQRLSSLSRSATRLRIDFFFKEIVTERHEQIVDYMAHKKRDTEFRFMKIIVKKLLAK